MGNLERWFKFRNLVQTRKVKKNGGFKNEILLVTKNGFENGFITRISTSFLTGFHSLKELSWCIFQWIMKVWNLKEMDLRILEILEKMGFSWTFWFLGLTWTSVSCGRLDRKVNSWACRKKLKTWVEILSWVKIKVYDGRFDSWAWKV